MDVADFLLVHQPYWRSPARPRYRRLPTHFSRGLACSTADERIPPFYSWHDFLARLSNSDAALRSRHSDGRGNKVLSWKNGPARCGRVFLVFARPASTGNCGRMLLFGARSCGGIICDLSL